MSAMLIRRRSFLSMAAAAPALAAAGAKDDISLAAWSINRSFFVNHRWKNLDLPRICREELKINGIEFVNQFFENPTIRYLQQLKRNLDDYGVTPVLVMIDSEGDMVAKDDVERRQAVVAHRKWVDVAHYLGCHAVRCNLGGGRQGWAGDNGLVARAADSFGDLLDYASDSGINVVIENHGGASSDPEVLVAVMNAVDNPRFGTLPDFGNLNPGGDPYEVIRKIVPWAKGISVKSRWTLDGKHPDYDLAKLIKICKDSGFHGYWGIESGFDPGKTKDRRADYSGFSSDQMWAQELKAIERTKSVIRETLGLG